MTPLECAFCDNRAECNEVEGFPKYVIGDAHIVGDEQVAHVLCRDCFELAYRGADVEHRRWNISAQSVVLI